MNKIAKIIFSIIIVTSVVALGYFFTIRKANITSPTSRPPTSITFQETGNGCGDIFVYKINNDQTASISVSARRDKLNFSTAEKTFEIGKTDGLDVKILIGEKVVHSYCTDLLPPEQPTSRKLFGKSGKAIISVSDIDKSRPEWR